MIKILQKILIKIFPELFQLKSAEYDFTKLRSSFQQVEKGKYVKINPVSVLKDVKIGDYTYVSENAVIIKAVIGKFCSIGPNLLCGWGIHPTNGISTAPMFYSANNKPNGITLSGNDKIEEHKKVIIGNDVFIGANVTVLDGITIGDGAVIGAGTVVSKDIPPYAVAVGSPVQIKRYRFDKKQIDRLLRIQWWNFSEEQLKDVEKMFFDVDEFLDKYDK